jgi:hypothetical protein
MRRDFEMSDNANRIHPDIDTLAEFAAGESDDESTRRHLEECHQCRLEVRRLSRFQELDALDADDPLLREAAWSTARTRLERTFREDVLAPVADGRAVPERARASRSIWERWQIRWLVPAAAAAAVLLLVFQTDWVRQAGTPSEDLGPVRGTPVESPDIVLKRPLGKISTAPDVFEWQTKIKEDYYSIAIFTSNLEKVFEVARVIENHWTAADSLKALLKDETLYLWSVTGHKGVEPVTVSPNAWFMITDETPR